jgi:hypothetical protein
MMMIMAEADENEDNIIQYEEFVPVCVELLQAFRVRRSPCLFFHLSLSAILHLAEKLLRMIVHSSCL